MSARARTAPVSLFLSVLLSSAALFGCGPTLVFPGGALDGTLRKPPSGWDFAIGIQTIQLETHPDDPYSVNIGCAVTGDALYISAGDNRARWVDHIEVDPRVRVRIDDALYEMRAMRVQDRDELGAFGKAWTAKYSFGRDPMKLGEVFVYRLESR